MARKKKPPEHVNHERWLVSYADFITLLFAFFTTLYAISTVDAKKAGKLVFSLRAVFDLDPFVSDRPVLGADSTEPPSVSGNVAPRLRPIRLAGLPSPRQPRKKITHLMHRLSVSLATFTKSDMIRITREPRGMVITLDAGGFFAAGSADLLPKSKQAVDLIAEALVQAKLPVRVDGHTDNTVATKGHLRSNWDLSTARAVTIVSYLAREYRYPPNLLSAAGYADTRPVVPNDTPFNRGRNRRLEIVVLRDAPEVTPLSWVKEPQEDEDE